MRCGDFVMFLESKLIDLITIAVWDINCCDTHC